jgi:hypothetical protein
MCMCRKPRTAVLLDEARIFPMVKSGDCRLEFSEIQWHERVCRGQWSLLNIPTQVCFGCAL